MRIRHHTLRSAELRVGTELVQVDSEGYFDTSESNGRRLLDGVPGYELAEIQPMTVLRTDYEEVWQERGELLERLARANELSDLAGRGQVEAREEADKAREEAARLRRELDLARGEMGARIEDLERRLAEEEAARKELLELQSEQNERLAGREEDISERNETIAALRDRTDKLELAVRILRARGADLGLDLAGAAEALAAVADAPAEPKAKGKRKGKAA